MAKQRIQQLPIEERIRRKIEQTLAQDRGGGRVAQLGEEFRSPGAAAMLLAALDDPRALAEPKVAVLRHPAFYLLESLAPHRLAEAIPRASALANHPELREPALRVILGVADASAGDALRQLHEAADEEGKQSLLNIVWHHLGTAAPSPAFARSLRPILVAELDRHSGFALRQRLEALLRMDAAVGLEEATRRGWFRWDHPEMPSAVEALVAADVGPPALPSMATLASELIAEHESREMGWQQGQALLDLLPKIARLDRAEASKLMGRLRGRTAWPFPRAAAKTILALAGADTETMWRDFHGTSGPGAPLSTFRVTARHVLVAGHADHILMHGGGFRELLHSPEGIFASEAFGAVGAVKAAAMFAEAKRLKGSGGAKAEVWSTLDESYGDREEDLDLLIDQYMAARASRFRPRRWRRHWHPYWWLMRMGERGRYLAMQWAIRQLPDEG